MLEHHPGSRESMLKMFIILEITMIRKRSKRSVQKSKMVLLSLEQALLAQKLLLLSKASIRMNLQFMLSDLRNIHFRMFLEMRLAQ